jgi:hypothetical protein
MPYEMAWLVERRIVHAVVHGKFPVSEIRQASEAASAMFDAGIKPVHFLVDIAAMQLEDFELDVIRSSAVYLQHPNLGWWIVYGSTNQLYYYLGRTIARLTRRRFFFAHSYAEAIQILQLHDASIAPLLPVQPPPST